MNKKTALGRAAAALLLLVFIAYIVIQVVSNLNERIATIDAMVVTVEDTISAEGVFVRSQRLVAGQAGKSAEYLVDDGAKVANGQSLALFFDSGAAAGAYEKVSDLNSKISGLEYARKYLAGGADLKKLDSLIYTEIQALSADLREGNAARADKRYPTLGQLVVSRGANITDPSQYTAQIEALNSQKAAYQDSLRASATAVQAECSGYFVQGADGFETVLTPQTLFEMTPQQLLAAKPDSTAVSGAVGSIVDSYEWYFAAVLDKAQADRFKERGVIDVYFPQIDSTSLTVSVHSVTTYGDQAVAIFKSGIMHSEYLSARAQSIDIVVRTHTGIKVPKEALRQVDGVWGVYCLDGAMSRFKPVNWVYQTDSFYLVEPAEDSKGLYMYDKIIVKGKELSDKKVVR